MDAELVRTLTFVLDLLRDYGLNDFYLELSTKPPGKAVGSDEEWEVATEALRRTALEMGLELVMDEGGGAFYGPKISVQARDAIGRTWQMSTVQLDFQLPRRFGLEYVGRRQRPPPADHDPPRAVRLGGAVHGRADRALRRRAADLAVPRAGARHPGHRRPPRLRAVRGRTPARRQGLRATVDASGEKMGALIRRAKLAKIPYVLVVGDEDVAAGTVGREPTRLGRQARARGRRSPTSCPRSRPRSSARACPRTAAHAAAAAS